MTKRKSILVGDGETWSVELLRQAAERHGLELHHARNGIEAIEMFKTLAPSIVVLDTLLPKLDGLKVTSKLREMELGRVTPIVVTSAIYRRGEDVDRLRQRFTFTDFLEKPFHLEDAVQLVGDYLREDQETPASAADVAEDDAPVESTNLAETPLSVLAVPRLLCDLADARKTGVLTLRRNEITKILVFERGRVTHARSNSKRDRLGRILLRTKRITLESYDRAKLLQLESGGRLPLGAALVRLGVLNENDVVNAVSTQILNIVFGVFAWEEGTWSFFETDNIPVEYRRFTFNTANLVFWGLRQLEGQEDFSRFLPNPRLVVERPADLARIKDGLHLTYFEEQILGLIDGRRRLGEIVALGRLAQIDVGRVLFSLFLLGVLRVSGTATAALAETGPAERTFDASGTLLRTSVARLFSRIHLARLSGTVSISREGGEVTEVGFDRGEVVSARSSRPDFWLGNILLRAGKVTEDYYYLATQEQAANPDKRIDAIFLELHALSIEELDWALRFQVQAIVLDLFRWAEGEYTFVEGEPPADAMLTLPETTPNLIMEGARSAAAPPRIGALLESAGAVLVKVWEEDRVAHQLHLSSAERRLVGYLDGGRTVTEVLALNLMQPDELARALHGLLALEVVRVLTDGASLKPEPSRALFRPDYLRAVPAVPPEDSISEEDTPFPPLHLLGSGAGNRLVGGRQSHALIEENRLLRDRLAALEHELLRMKASGRDTDRTLSRAQAIQGEIAGIRDRLQRQAGGA